MRQLDLAVQRAAQGNPLFMKVGHEGAHMRVLYRACLEEGDRQDRRPDNADVGQVQHQAGLLDAGHVCAQDTALQSSAPYLMAGCQALCLQ